MAFLLWYAWIAFSSSAFMDAMEAMLKLFAVIAGIWGGIIALKGTYKKHMKYWVSGFKDMVKDYPVMKETQRMQALDLAQIKHQVYPNNGGSIVDKLNFLINQQSSIKAKQRAQMNTDASPCFVIDKDGDLVYVNDAWLRLTGFQKPEQAYGTGWLKAIPEENHKSILEVHQQQIDYPTDFFDSVTFKHIVTGQCVETICRVTCVKNEAGELIEKIGQLQIVKN